MQRYEIVYLIIMMTSSELLTHSMRHLNMDKCINALQKTVNTVALSKQKMSLPTNVSSSSSLSSVCSDTYSKEVLMKTYLAHKNYVKELLTIRQETQIKVRLPNMPEHISENIVKFIIQNKMGDMTSSWDCKKGDLYSNVEKQQECKTFTSDGPPSFGPNEEWNVLYFLDARKWLEDKYVLYRVGLSNRDDAWRNVKVNKAQTFHDQCQQNRRPRITWEALYPQIESYCTKIFEGTFEEIFVKIIIPLDDKK